MVQVRICIIVAILALASVIEAQTTEVINKLVPLTIRIASTRAGAIGVTPQIPAGRRLLREHEEIQGEAGWSLPRRSLQQAVYSSPAQLTDEFKSVILPNIAASKSLVFLGQAKEDTISEVAQVSYVFDATSQAFLKGLAQSGSTFQFLGAKVILPQEQNSANVPSFAESDTGFVSKDGSPVVVSLSTQKPSNVVPQVALRFDYAQKSTSGATPFVSIYYTDRTGPAPAGLAQANLQQTYGIYVAADGKILPGQG